MAGIRSTVCLLIMAMVVFIAVLQMKLLSATTQRLTAIHNSQASSNGTATTQGICSNTDTPEKVKIENSVAKV